MVHSYPVQTTGTFFSALQGALDARGLEETFAECFGSEASANDAIAAKEMFKSCDKWEWRLKVLKTPKDKDGMVSIPDPDKKTIYLHKDGDNFGFIVLEPQGRREPAADEPILDQEEPADEPSEEQPSQGQDKDKVPMTNELTIVDDEDNEIEMVCGEELPSLVDVNDGVEFETALDLNDDQLMFHVMSLLTADASNIAQNRDVWSRMARQFIDVIKSRKEYDASSTECKSNRRLAPIVKGVKVFVRIDDNDFFPYEEDEDYVKLITMNMVLQRIWKTEGPFKDYQRLSYEKEKTFTNTIADNDMPIKQWTPCRHSYGFLYHPEKRVAAFAPCGSKLDVVGIGYMHPGRVDSVSTFDMPRYMQFLTSLVDGDTAIQIDAMTGKHNKVKVVKADAEAGSVELDNGKLVHTTADKAWHNDVFIYPPEVNASEVFYRGKGGLSQTMFYVDPNTNIEQALKMGTPCPDDVVYHNPVGLCTIADVESIVGEYGFNPEFDKISHDVAKEAIESNVIKLGRASRAAPLPQFKGRRTIASFFTRTMHAMMKNLHTFGYTGFSSKGTWRDADYARMRDLTKGADKGTIAFAMLVANHIDAILSQPVGVQGGGAPKKKEVSASCKEEELDIKKKYESIQALKADNFKEIAGVGIGDYARVDDDHSMYRRFKDAKGHHVWVKDMMIYHKQCARDAATNKEHIPSFKKFMDQKCIMDEIERACRSKLAIQQENAQRLSSLKQEMMDKAAWIHTNADSLKRMTTAYLYTILDGTMVYNPQPTIPTFVVERTYVPAANNGGMETSLDFSDLPHYAPIGPGGGSTVYMDDWFVSLMASINLSAVGARTWPYMTPLQAAHEEAVKAIHANVNTKVAKEVEKARVTHAKTFEAKRATIEKQGRATSKRMLQEEQNRYDKEKMLTAVAVAMLLSAMNTRSTATSLESVVPSLAKTLRIAEDTCEKDIVDITNRFLERHIDIAKAISNSLLVELGVQAAYTQPWGSFKPQKPGHAVNNPSSSRKLHAWHFGKAQFVEAEHMNRLFTEQPVSIPHVAMVASAANKPLLKCQNHNTERAMEMLGSPNMSEFWDPYSDEVAASVGRDFVVNMVGSRDPEQSRMLLLEFLVGEMRTILGEICKRGETLYATRFEIKTALVSLDACLKTLRGNNEFRDDLVILIYLDLFGAVLRACNSEKVAAMIKDKCQEYMDRNSYDEGVLANERERLREVSKNNKIAYLESIDDEDKKKEVEQLLKMGLLKWEDVLNGSVATIPNMDETAAKDGIVGEGSPYDYQEEEPDATYQTPDDDIDDDYE
jgi:hypothetical protein